MNNLHRDLAPISEAAWAGIEEEAARTLKRHLAARRVVDMTGPSGPALSAVGTGHVASIAPPAEGVQSLRREVKALVELRVPFQLARSAIDDVERGALDPDWAPLKEAMRKIAFAEDRAVFDGYDAADIQGIRAAASNPAVPLPADAERYPERVARAVGELRLAGVEGPYALVLGGDAYMAASGGSDDGYPVFHHLERMVDGGVIWAPAIAGGLVLSLRGGDFELTVGRDFSIGYLSHSATTVDLYVEESFTFRPLTTEAAVALPAE
ncbi:MAG: bacteriocin family protein [Rhizobiaceae bacterium]|nr:bacteriocin family protein [Rhizobiaceae bacterium]